MIVRNKPKAFQLFFIVRGSIVPRILPQILFFALLGGAVAAAQDYFPDIFPEQTLAPFTLLGVALSLFLGFRNNAAYDRWWEARRQWGQLIVDSRSLARQATSYISANIEGGPEVQKRLVTLTIAFSHALRHELRGTDAWEDIERYVKPEDIERLRHSRNLPDSILRLIGAKLGDCRQKNYFPTSLFRALMTTLPRWRECRQRVNELKIRRYLSRIHCSCNELLTSTASHCHLAWPPLKGSQHHYFARL